MKKYFYTCDDYAGCTVIAMDKLIIVISQEQ